LINYITLLRSLYLTYKRLRVHTVAKNDVVPSVSWNNPGKSFIQVSSPKNDIDLLPTFFNCTNQLSWYANEEEVSDSAILRIASRKFGTVPVEKKENFQIEKLIF